MEITLFIQILYGISLTSKTEVTRKETLDFVRSLRTVSRRPVTQWYASTIPSELPGELLGTSKHSLTRSLTLTCSHVHHAQSAQSTYVHSVPHILVDGRVSAGHCQNSCSKVERIRLLVGIIHPTPLAFPFFSRPPPSVLHARFLRYFKINTCKLISMNIDY